MRLSALTGRTVTSTIRILDEDVPITLRPSAHTSAFEDRMRAAMSGNDARLMAALLAELVVAVDIVGDDGEPIACTGDAFYELLPLDVMTGMWEAAARELRPGEAKGATSAAG